MKTDDEIAQIITKGLYDAFVACAKYLAAVLFLYAMFMLACQWGGYGLDSTDGESRSNMSLHTDAMTGCQYLSSKGSLIKRVDSEGKHICIEPTDKEQDK